MTVADHEETTECVFLYQILRAYKMDRETFVAACSQTPEEVSPWEVGAVCLIDCQEEGRCDSHTMASYLDSVLRGEDNCSEISSRLLGNEEVLLASLSILLSGGPEKEETVTGEGNPL